MQSVWLTLPCLLMVLAGDEAPVKPEPPLTARQIAESASPAVVLFETVKGDNVVQASGFVGGSTGTLVTNLHVLDGATHVTVTLSDGRRFDEVSVLAFDVEEDLAVARIEAPAGGEPMPTVELGRSAVMRPGDPIIVISNPMGLALSVTQGIVSAWREPREAAVERDMMEDRSPILPLPTRRLLQISAAISPGSSGAPVLDDKGKVIGIAMAGMLYGMVDINFAVPVDDVPSMLRQDSAMDLATFQKRVDRARLDLARPYLEKAELAFEQDDARAAKRHLERALLIYPAYEGALLLSGRIKMSDGDLAGAERLFLRAVKANDASAEAWYRMADLYAVMAADSGSLSTIERAQSAYEKCLELDERHPQAAFGLALLHVRRGNLSEAEALLRGATEQDANLSDAQTILGLILLERGEIEEAEAALRQAVWQDDQHALAHYGLAQALTSRSETRRSAAGHWEKFLQLSRNDPSLKREREVAIRIVGRFFPGIDVR